MADVLIRNVPPDDLRRLDEQARRLGLSRADFLRRQLHKQAATTVLRVSLEDLQEVADTLSDLSDPNDPLASGQKLTFTGDASRSLLLVDDDAPFRTRLARAMEKRGFDVDRKSTRLNSSHSQQSRMPSSA